VHIHHTDMSGVKAAGRQGGRVGRPGAAANGGQLQGAGRGAGRASGLDWTRVRRSAKRCVRIFTSYAHAQRVYVLILALSVGPALSQSLCFVEKLGSVKVMRGYN
jgi:hypothetical protein